MRKTTQVLKFCNEPWRVEVLDDALAGTGVFPSGNQRFTSADEGSYVIFTPQACCELPGKPV